MKLRIVSLGLALSLALCACAQTETAVETGAAEQSGETAQVQADYFSDRDFEVGYDESASALIQLNGDGASCDSDAVRIDGTTVTITDEGTYVLSGTLDDGMIIVDSEKTDKTQLVLNGASIHSQTCAAIYVRQSDKVFLTTADGTENSLSNGGSFEAIDENNIDGVIFSKEDLTMNGSGSLSITSPAGHGVVSKDSLTVTSGSYAITCASHGLAGKDDVSVANAQITVVSGKDGIHAENADDETLGSVYIQSGTFDITAEGDGISAAATLRIDDGAFQILTGGGSANAAQQTSENWGGFMGGGFMGGGDRGRGDKGPGDQFGGPMEDPNAQPETEEESSEDSTSIKGLKAAGELTVNGGSFSIDSADDAVHSNTNVTVSGGSFSVSSGDDGFHADDTLTIQSGTILITQSYEGLEGLHVAVEGGDITLTASDDGINAAGGTDSSGFGGPRGEDQFGGGMGGSSDGSVTISGGTVSITASGDGIDANGTLAISGGFTTVCGPTQGDTATLDYDVSATITGGTFIGTGASGMAQTFSDAQQGLLSLSVGSQSAGTAITVTDSSGNVIIEHSPALSFGVVIVSSPELIKGETYTVSVGSQSADFAAK